MHNVKLDKIPNIAKAGKVGHGKTKQHKGRDPLAAGLILTAGRPGSGAKQKIREHGAHGLSSANKLAATRKGATR